MQLVLHIIPQEAGGCILKRQHLGCVYMDFRILVAKLDSVYCSLEKLALDS